jgi:hypothetical protein
LGKEINRDELIGINMPRGSYALSGGDWDTSVAGAGAPMIINSHTPGIHGDAWNNTYGSSHDSFLSIVDGTAIESSINGVSLGGVYLALPNTASDNLWDKPGGKQQVQYVVSGATIDEGRNKIESFGALSEARGLCMRLPMMACGYGKTKEMLPLIGGGRQNPSFIKTNRSFWNTGSVDMRWDSKRKMWSTFNDLIVDHEGAGLGTAVYSTNPNGSEGFPYLKGRLQDVWWVRQPTDLDGTDGKVDGGTTAEIMTHLEHKFYDNDEKGAAKLSSIFIIPHASLADMGTPDVCHEKGDENILGDDLTGEGASIDIKVEAHWYKDAETDGPIRFGSKLTELGDAVCCDNGAAKLFLGEMIFLDDKPDRCDGAPPEAGPPPCEWVPAVRIDECQLMGGHIGQLVQNDVNIVEQMSSMCVGINSWSNGKLTNEVQGGFNDLAAAVSAACDEIESVASQTEAGFADLAQQIDGGLGSAISDVETQLNAFAALVSAAILSCCEIAIDFNFSFAPTPHGFVTPCIEADCNGPLIDVDLKFPCGECKLVSIAAPCSDQDKETFTVGFNCDTDTSTTSQKPTFGETGQCQAN